MDPDERQNVHNQHPDVVGEQRARIEALLGTSIPQSYSQDRFGPTVTRPSKPLYAESYAPLLYRARQEWDEPRALPR